MSVVDFEKMSAVLKLTEDSQSGTRRLDDVQSLRAVAALLVLLSHVVKELSSRSAGIVDVTNMHVWGQFGVDIFFVISGFIMVYVSDKDRGQVGSPTKFLLRRIARLVPLYWLFTTATLIVTLLLSGLKNHNDISLDYVVGSYLFIPFMRSDGNFTPVLGVGWTLNYEMLFYVLFALSLYLPARMQRLGICIALVALTLVGMVVPTHFHQFWYWTRPIILEFAGGALIGILFLRGVKLPIVGSAFLVVVGVLSVIIATRALGNPVETGGRLWAWGGGAILIVGAILLSASSYSDLLPPPIARLISMMGDASYSLYLSHMFVVRLISVTLGALLGWRGQVFFIVGGGMIVAAIVVAMLTYRFVEQPLTKRAGNLLDQALSKRARKAG